RPALDPERQPARGRLDAGSQPPERLRDALHRPRPERLVAGELEAAARLPREQTGDEPDERARVAAVDGIGGLGQAAEPGATYGHRVAGVLDRDAERAQR